jgi:hypothetical protein
VKVGTQAALKCTVAASKLYGQHRPLESCLAHPVRAASRLCRSQDLTSEAGMVRRSLDVSGDKIVIVQPNRWPFEEAVERRIWCRPSAII